MPADTSNLYLPQDLENSDRTSKLAASDLNALRTVANWIKNFVATPHKDLGRAGPVCPFVPRAWERETLWLAPEQLAHKSVPELVQLVNDYRRLFLRVQPVDGDEASFKAIVVVFTDLAAERAKDYLEDVRIQNLKRLSYADDGVVLGEFHERNDGSAIRNPSFKPFRSPVPFLLIRRAVASDWMFFLDDEDWLGFWARRFGESAIRALAGELRRTNWRELGNS